MKPEMETILEKAIAQRPYTEDGTRLPARLNIPHLERWNTVICIGDSINEGLWDSEDPSLDLTTYESQENNPDSPVAGWADRLAGHLSARRVELGLEPVKYANLAIRGKLIKDIVEVQLPKALSMKPDLILMDGGGNDILEPGGPSITQVYNYIRKAVRQVRRTGCDLLYLLPSQPGDAVIGITRSKQSDYAARLESLMMRYDCYTANLWNYTNFSDARMWSEDRIHPTPEGHERIAQVALIGMGLPPDPVWANGELRRPLPGHVEPLGDRAREEARWLRLYFTPWLARRINGTSTGDNRTGKRPVPTPMPPFTATKGSLIIDQEFMAARDHAKKEFDDLVAALEAGEGDPKAQKKAWREYEKKLEKDGINSEDILPHRYTPEQIKQMWIAQKAQLAVDMENGISPEESWKSFRKKRDNPPADVWELRDLKPLQTAQSQQAEKGFSSKETTNESTTETSSKGVSTKDTSNKKDSTKNGSHESASAQGVSTSESSSSSSRKSAAKDEKGVNKTSTDKTSKDTKKESKKDSDKDKKNTKKSHK